jgi:hypothetical protein
MKSATEYVGVLTATVGALLGVLTVPTPLRAAVGGSAPLLSPINTILAEDTDRMSAGVVAEDFTVARLAACTNP